MGSTANTTTGRLPGRTTVGVGSTVGIAVGVVGTGGVVVGSGVGLGWGTVGSVLGGATTSGI